MVGVFSNSRAMLDNSPIIRIKWVPWLKWFRPARAIMRSKTFWLNLFVHTESQYWVAKLYYSCIYLFCYRPTREIIRWVLCLKAECLNVISRNMTFNIKWKKWFGFWKFERCAIIQFIPIWIVWRNGLSLCLLTIISSTWNYGLLFYESAHCFLSQYFLF